MLYLGSSQMQNQSLIFIHRCKDKDDDWRLFHKRISDLIVHSLYKGLGYETGLCELVPRRTIYCTYLILCRGDGFSSIYEVGNEEFCGTAGRDLESQYGMVSTCI
jgi:hypothetical protein